MLLRARSNSFSAAKLAMEEPSDPGSSKKLTIVQGTAVSCEDLSSSRLGETVEQEGVIETTI